MNHKKIKNTLKHVSLEEAEKISKTWADPHKEQVWTRINEKLAFKEESPMKEQITVSQNRNANWKSYLSIAAGIMLFCGIVGYSAVFIGRSGRYLPEPQSPVQSAVEPSETLETTIPATETEPISTQTEPAVIVPETTVTTTETIATTFTETSTSTTETTTTATTTFTEPETIPETSPEEPETIAELPDVIATEAPTEETALETEAPTEKDLFAGDYAEEHSSRCQIEVRNTGNGYHVHIYWSGSFNEFGEWDFNGDFNDRAVLYYTDCVMKHVTFNADGTSNEEIEYTDGSGYLKISEEGTKTGLTWHDDQENIADEYFFIRYDE